MFQKHQMSSLTNQLLEKISKIFLHLYDGNTLEDVELSDSQITEVDGSHCYIDSDGVTR